MPEGFPVFLWQLQHPLQRIGGEYAIVANRPPPDGESDLVGRIVEAFRRAVDTDVGPSDNIWLSHFASMNADTHKALMSGTIQEVAAILANPAASNLFYGFDGPTAIDVDNANDQFARDMTRSYTYDCLLSFAAAIGARRVENPEAPKDSPPPSPDEILSQIDKALGFKLSLPNLFNGETGIRTSRGVLSHRAVLALYHTWRIFDLVDQSANSSVLEIGAGLGRTAFFARQFGIRKYTIVDLPTTNVCQAYFLGRTLGPENISLHGESTSAFVTVVPPEDFLRSDDGYDLIVNIDSMTEFSVDTARAYLNRFFRRAGKFVSFNHESNEFSVRELLQQKSPEARISRSPHWLRRGYVEETIVFSD